MVQRDVVEFKKGFFYLIYHGEVAIHKRVQLKDPNNLGVHNS